MFFRRIGGLQDMAPAEQAVQEMQHPAEQAVSENAAPG
jgi:hypothetical protein